MNLLLFSFIIAQAIVIFILLLKLKKEVQKTVNAEYFKKSITRSLEYILHHSKDSETLLKSFREKYGKFKYYDKGGLCSYYLNENTDIEKLIKDIITFLAKTVNKKNAIIEEIINEHTKQTESLKNTNLNKFEIYLDGETNLRIRAKNNNLLSETFALEIHRIRGKDVSEIREKLSKLLAARLIYVLDKAQGTLELNL